MRIATWNVNSLKARQERVALWLERTAPDVLLMQETKLADKDAPHAAFEKLGYQLAHHGQGRWNGVAIASKVGIEDVEVRFGDPAPEGEITDGADPLREARIIAATCGRVRVVSLYAPNGRVVPSAFYEAKLGWYERLARWLGDDTSNLLLGGDYNIAPSDRDVWDPKVAHGGTHVSPRERAAFERLLSLGLVDAYRAHHDEPERYSWWDYRAGDFYRNVGMRIDHFLAGASIAKRTVAVEIDREARKGKPTPSDHAPVVIDLDAPGVAFDPGWEGAADRIAARRAKAKG